MTSADNNCCPLTRVAAILKSAAEHQRWKEYAEAERLCREAVDIARAELPADHPVVGTSLCDLGNVLYEQDRVFEAREIYTEALYILEKRLGNSDPQVLWVFAHLHDLYR
jgi:tetratricopeptide (TPR) repeat protein